MKSVERFLQASKSNNLCVSGTRIGEQAFLISKLSSPVFFIVGDSETAFKAEQQLLALGKRVAIIDSTDNPYIVSKYQSNDSLINLLNALYCMINNNLDVVMLTPQSVNLKLGNPRIFKENIIEFGLDKTIDIQKLPNTLIKLGYIRAENVQQVGEFAIRGEVIDIFSPNHTYPIRINLFDDVIENIVYFDNINLSTISKLEHFQICPMKDFILEEDECLQIVKKLYELSNITKENKLYELTSNFEVSGKISNEYLGLVGYELSTIFDYLPKARVAISNPLNVKTKLDEIRDEQIKLIDNLFNSDEIKNIITPYKEVDFGEDLIVFDSLGNFNTKNKLDLPVKNLTSYLYKTDLIKYELAPVRKKQIQLCLDNDYTFNSIKNLLTSNGVSVSTNLKDDGIVLTQNKLPYNVCFVEDDVWYIGSSNFAHKKTIVSNKKSQVKFLPKAGDYVVHEVHGIGRCEGVVTLNVMGADKDFFKIIYKNEDVLYVPTENANSLSLYMHEGNTINLNRLGGKEFSQNIARAQQSIEDMSKELLELYSKRQNSKGYKYSDDNYLCTEFDNAFEHTETSDQMQAIQDIKNDMTAGKVMDRLVCGDVGYGKTEVAMRAAFRVAIEGKQVAVLAPTTILSLQHFMTFTKRFKNFDIRIEMLNRFKSPKEKADIIKRLKEGKIDIICGTHSLVADSVGFKDLGLLILDEEQRFGVKAKEKLKNIKNNVNVITMSATPIPRTLNMALLTLRDISIINTPPQNRLPVKTYVVPYDINLITQAINSEIGRGGQALIVYNDIEKIYNFASKIKEKLTDVALLDVAHGKMTRIALENAVQRLYDGKTNVFISTTLIENGVDLPNANTLIVIDSQNLGLSQMYQLRGRVGRNNQQAYAYFTYPADKSLTIEATNRLEALAENTELGSGFKIAMRDLQLRGAGELLGKSQHGHMIKIGYDMYVKLLDETTKRLMGQNTKKFREVKLDIAINALIPSGFVSDETEKIKIYSKISNITDIDSQKEVVESLRRTYNRVPKEVMQLTNVATIKALAQKLGVKHIVIDKANMFIEFYEDSANLDKLLEDISKFPKFGLKKSTLPTIKLNSQEFSPETAQGYIIGYLKSKCEQM